MKIIHTRVRDPYEQEYLDWYNRPHSPGEPFDPAGLVALARKQWSDHPQLADAFARCTREWHHDERYMHFMNPMTIGQPDSRWNFKSNLPLRCPVHGALIVDVMADGSIGGIEFLDRVMGHPVDLDRLLVTAAALAGKHRDAMN